MLVYLLTILVSTNVASSYESAQYLQSAVRDLRKLKLRRADTAMVSALPEVVPQKVPVQTKVDRRIRHGDEVPPISLTKGELAALYEAAITKGETLKLDTGDNTYINAAVHELDTSENQESHNYDLPKKTPRFNRN
ncbi:hypothetical protein NQ317_010434 [Molorchus minor]|uniref:Uncharacterized protein n=1 Tax=Molorchus minor TaxID=1323400 RepID=A0ABQ9JXL4_9CUCU|nr:hypothetical protein NQ317_010434 [Molorchus minor]